jgi:hypothetical protein
MGTRGSDPAARSKGGEEMMRPKRALGMISDVETAYNMQCDCDFDKEDASQDMLRDSRRDLFKALVGRLPTDEELDRM